jgi:hypothetical protein
MQMSSFQDREKLNYEQTREQAKYGIFRTTVDYFHYKDFRYTNLGDAIAQAKRQTRQVDQTTR